MLQETKNTLKIKQELKVTRNKNTRKAIAQKYEKNNCTKIREKQLHIKQKLRKTKNQTKRKKNQT